MTRFASTRIPARSGLSRKYRVAVASGSARLRSSNVAFKVLPQFHIAVWVSFGVRLPPLTDRMAVGSTILPGATSPVEKDSLSFL